VTANIEIYADREAWLEARVNGIGGSEAPIVLGVSPYDSSYSLWATKTNRVPRKPATRRMELGNRFEPIIRDLAVEELGYEIESAAPFTMHRHSQHPWAFASLDAKILPIDSRGPGNLQIKKVSGYLSHEWDDGKVPLHIQVQVQHEMFAAELKWAVVAAFIGGDDLVIREVPRNERFIEAMVAKELEFIACIENDMPPAVDGSEATATVLKRIYGSDTGASVDLPAEFDGLDSRLSEVKKQIAALEAEEKLIRNRITAAIGDATYGVLPGGGRWRRKWIRKEVAAREAYTSEYPDLRRVK
jgi:putative phage-type endonuclease